MRKKVAIIFAALTASALSLSGKTDRDALEIVRYTLPQTVIKVSVDVVRNAHYAGELAAFSEQMLGTVVPQKDTFRTLITKVRIEAVAEADLSDWHTLIKPVGTKTAYLTMTPQGYVSGRVRLTPTDAACCVPMAPARERLSGSAQVSAESAKTVADKILELRSMRYSILTGDTDATYSGEALKTASDELKAMEEKKLSDFVGEDESSVASASFAVIPVAGENQQNLPVFRLSDRDGLMPSSCECGTQYFIEIDAPRISQTEMVNLEMPFVLCRIPAVCEVRLTDGENTVASARIPVYQLGPEVRYPVIIE